MKRKILKLLGKGAELVCPFPCLSCGMELADGKNLFCEKCLNDLSIINNPRCRGCGGILDGVLEYCSKCMEFEKRPWDGAFALFNLSGAGQKLLYAFKFYGRPELARPFASLAKDIVEKENLVIDLIIPVPLHWSRCFTRGYNQSALFAEHLASLTNIKFLRALRRIKKTRQQARLDKDQRKKNLSGAFALKSVDLRGKTILLVDDVMTTGATLAAATKAFANSEAKAIHTLVVGRR